MAYRQRLITYSFILAEGSFGNSGKNRLNLSGLRCTNKIVKAGGASMGQLQCSIFGMTLSQMNQLSTLGMKVQLQPKNRIIVNAGDAKSGMTKVFEGTISYAVANLEGQPQGNLTITAMEGLGEAVQGVEVTSYSKPVDVATVMANLAQQAGLNFESNGVSVLIPKTYYAGSLRSQMEQAATDAGIYWGIENGTLFIIDKTKFRLGNQIPDISPETGMIGYPSYMAQGISVKTIFNPDIKFMGRVQVTSQIVPKSTWTVSTLEHDLDSLMPHGNWMSTLGCFNSDFPPVTK